MENFNSWYVEEAGNTGTEILSVVSTQDIEASGLVSL